MAEQRRHAVLHWAEEDVGIGVAAGGKRTQRPDQRRDQRVDAAEGSAQSLRDQLGHAGVLHQRRQPDHEDGAQAGRQGGMPGSDQRVLEVSRAGARDAR